MATVADKWHCEIGDDDLDYGRWLKENELRYSVFHPMRTTSRFRGRNPPLAEIPAGGNG